LTAELFTEAGIADPYPIYARLREQSPVIFDESFGGWLISRYEDVARCFKHSHLSTRHPGLPLPDDLPADLVRMHDEITHVLTDWISFQDPPRHTGIRKLMNKSFKPSLIRNMRPVLQEMLDDLIDAARARERLDFIDDIAFPYPALVIAELLGLPHELRGRLHGWTTDIVDYMADYSHSIPELITAMHRTIGEMGDAIRQVIGARRTQPREDLISHMLTAEDAGAQIGEDMIVALGIMMLFAAHETTSNFIGNGMHTLLGKPATMTRLREEPELMATALDEMLRFEPPVQYTARTTREPITLGGVRIPKGARIFPFIASANRDPAVFSDPDSFDITRMVNPHLSFGHGTHFCLGRPLALLEGEIAIGTFLKRVHGVKMKPETLRWRQSPSFHGLSNLPLDYSQITD